MTISAKILIVDDNPIIHDMIGKLLSRGDDGQTHLILHADNGQAALKILGSNPDIDVIVLDLHTVPSHRDKKAQIEPAFMRDEIQN